MGVVYLAHDLQLDREVALKTLPRVTSDAARRLRGEARAMAAVRHPNVVQIHGLETWCGVPVLVLEHLTGGTLQARLGRRMEVAAALELALALAGGLEAVHAAGLLHRDVKPSNVGFDAAGTPRLLDFGLSRIAADGEAPLFGGGVVGLSSRFAGTPLYMSPDVVAGAEPGPADDVWSLLVLLYECLAGSHPLRNVPREDLGRALEEPGFPHLRRLRPDVPVVLADTLGQWLRGRDRPATPAEARRTLRKLGG
jgi:eukaryotic-like serine/threonine-protein kinase